VGVIHNIVLGGGQASILFQGNDALGSQQLQGTGFVGGIVGNCNLGTVSQVVQALGLARVQAKRLVMDGGNAYQVGVVLLVKVLQVGAVLEVVGVDSAVFDNGVGHDIVIVDLDVEGDVLLGEDALHDLEDLSVRGRRSGDGDGLASESVVVDSGVKAVGRGIHGADNGAVILLVDVVDDLLALQSGDQGKDLGRGLVAFLHGQDVGVSGGGTFDVSVIEIGDNLIEVLATAGDNHLGGDDFDERITNYLVTEFYRQQNVDLRKDNTAMQRVREEAEKAKKVLSSSSSTTINLPFITTVKGQPVHMEMNLTRAEFNEITKDLVERTAIPVNQALSDAGISAAELGMVLLVGGSTRVPAVVEEVRRITGKEPSHNLNPDECVALGAAVQGGKLGGAIVAGSSAAEIILMDVTPLSLGIETVGGVSTKIIDRNTTIPTRYSQIFTTAGSFQTSVDIKVLQGERQFARDNKLIGNFRLKGIKPAPAGVPQIEVTFDIDANGIVQVSAKDLGTGKHQEITITASSNLSDSEIEQAIREAQEYEATDGQRKAYIDARSEADTLVRQVENVMADKEKRKAMDSAQKKSVKSSLSYVKKLISRTKPGNVSEEQAAEIKHAADELRNAAAGLI